MALAAARLGETDAATRLLRHGLAIAPFENPNEAWIVRERRRPAHRVRRRPRRSSPPSRCPGSSCSPPSPTCNSATPPRASPGRTGHDRAAHRDGDLPVHGPGGSTRLWEQLPDAMRGALARHDEILRDAVEKRDGVVVKTTGDGLHAAFATAQDAIAAAVDAQRALDDRVLVAARAVAGAHGGPHRGGRPPGGRLLRDLGEPGRPGVGGGPRRPGAGLPRHRGAGAGPPARRRGAGGPGRAAPAGPGPTRAGVPAASPGLGGRASRRCGPARRCPPTCR